MENKIKRSSGQIFWLYFSLLFAISVVVLAVFIFVDDNGWSENTSTMEKLITTLFISLLLGFVPVVHLIYSAYIERFSRVIGFTIWSVDVWIHEEQTYEKMWRVHTTYEYDKFFMHKYLGKKSNSFVIENEIKILEDLHSWVSPTFYLSKDEVMLSILKEARSMENKDNTDNVKPYVGGTNEGFFTIESLITPDIDDKISKLEEKIDNDNAKADTSRQ